MWESFHKLTNEELGLAYVKIHFILFFSVLLKKLIQTDYVLLQKLFPIFFLAEQITAIMVLYF